MRHYLYVVTVALATLLASAPMVGNAQAPVETPDERLVSQIAKALTNDPQAQYELGRMYEHGVGTPPDPKLAHFWYAKAAKQNFRPALDKIESWDAEIERQQEREQAERARKAEAARVARERAAQLEAEAAAKAARQRAAEEAAAKAAKEKAAQEAAAKAAKEQAAQEAAAATARLKRQEATAAPPNSPPRSKSDAPAAGAAPTSAAGTGAEKKGGEDKTEFSANPCKGPSAKFLSTCQ